MQSRFLLATLALCLPFALVACTDGVTQPQLADQAGLEEVELGPLANYINGPVNPGKSGVNRLEFDFCFWCESTDPERRLFAAHYQADDIFYCGGSSGLATWQATMVGNQSGEIWNQSHGEFPIFIYDLDDLIAAGDAGFPEPLCTFLVEEWLYQGTHTQASQDKSQGDDFYTRMKGHGTVYDQNGVRYQYTEHQKFVRGVGWTHEDIRIN